MEPRKYGAFHFLVLSVSCEVADTGSLQTLLLELLQLFSRSCGTLIFVLS